MKYVSWYTKNTVYEEVYHKTLKPSLDKYGLEAYTVSMPNHKRWNLNVSQKPLVILDVMYDLKEPFVLLDADCEVTNNPTLFNEIDPNKYDIAYHTLDWSKWYNRPHDVRKELLTGTMWFNCNDEVKSLVAEWEKYCTANNCADQRPLEHLMLTRYKHLRVFHLSLEYCYINTMPNGNKPFVKIDNPIVTHYQASRSTRRGIL